MPVYFFQSKYLFLEFFNSQCMHHQLLIVFFLGSFWLRAQIPEFVSIGDPPQEVTSQNIIAHAIRGIGFRYYWATQGLREQDLNFKPSTKARSSRETLEHLYGLSIMIHSTVFNQMIKRTNQQKEWTFELLRQNTLDLIQQASTRAMNLSDAELQALSIRFYSSDEEIRYPIWNFIQGPLADAQYHIGQLVSFRRSSGNPIDPNVNVFLGLRQLP